MIVGLGNPGPTYANTRHNIGFIVVDELARRLGVAENAWKTKDRARQIHVRDRDLILVEPQSFMNESGVPTRVVASWYRIPPERILVVYDDIDLPFGRLRMRERGSSGGHNGVKSLIAHFDESFPRIKIGVGRGAGGDAINRVLGAFSPDERAYLDAIVETSVAACLTWLDRGFVPAANAANAWRLPEEGKNGEAKTKKAKPDEAKIDERPPDEGQRDKGNSGLGKPNG